MALKRSPRARHGGSLMTQEKSARWDYSPRAGQLSRQAQPTAGMPWPLSRHTGSSRDHRAPVTCAGLRRPQSSLPTKGPRWPFPPRADQLLPKPCHGARAGNAETKLLTAASHRAPLGGKRTFAMETRAPQLALALAVAGTARLSPGSSRTHDQNRRCQKQNLSYLSHSAISYLLSDIFHKCLLPPSKSQHSSSPELVFLGELRSRTAACVMLPRGFAAEMES